MAKKIVKRKSSSSGFWQNNKKIVFYGAVILCAALAGYFIVFSKAAVNVNTTAPAAPALYVTPRSQTLGPNETYTVEIRANSGTTAVNAVQSYLAYPTTLVDLVSVDVSTSAYGVQAENDTTTPGLIKIARGASGGTSLTGDQLVAKATFRTKASAGSLTMDISTGRLIKSTDNTELLTASNIYDGAYQVDATGPTVSISAPANNSTVEYGPTYNITATATDSGSSVKQVEFYVDNVLKSTDTTSPYSYSWATTSVTENTAHAIKAVAIDNLNNSTTSAVNTVTVRDTVKPTVSLTAPIANQLVEGSIAISANASDTGTGIAKVDFMLGTTLLGSDTTSPYSITWDSKTVSDGAKSITAVAFDKAATANSTTSTAVSINVDNSDKIAPTAPTSFRSSNITKDSVKLDWNASTDNVGVVAYELMRGTTVIQNNGSLTFSDTGLTPSTDYKYTVVAVDAAGNKSTAATLTVTTLTPLPGDTNSDQVVDLVDLSRLLSAWNTQNGNNSDFNGDNIVDIVDLSILLSNWTR